MFSLTKIYTDYQKSTPEELEELIRKEMQENYGAKVIEISAQLNKGFKIAKDYVNNHSTLAQTAKRNENG